MLKMWTQNLKSCQTRRFSKFIRSADADRWIPAFAGMTNFLRMTLFLILILVPFTAQANPFTNGHPSELTATATSLFATPFMQDILRIQQHIHQALTEKVVDLKEGHSLAPLWGLLLLSFAYGIFHVLAPGHGKIIVGSYFLGNRARWGDGVWAGFIMSAGHTLTALLIVGILAFVFGLGQLDVLDRARYVELLGYGLIAAIGLWMLARAFRSSNGCACCCDGKHIPAETDLLHNRRALGLFTATSLVPCTGSMIILLFTLANDVLWAGVLAVIAIALGMWLTVTIIGTLSIALRKTFADRPAPSRLRQAATRILNILAASLVLATGGLLFAGTLASLAS